MKVVVVVILVIGSLVVLYLIRDRLTAAGGRRREFRRHSLVAVRAAESGARVRLAGLVRAVDEAPVSEVSGRSFVARDLRIVESDGASSSSTRPARQVVDFLVDDGTGVALVRGGGAVVSIGRDFEAPRTTLDQVPWVDALLRAGGYRNGSPETCRIRVYEGVIEPGERVGVIGRIEPPDSAASALGATVVVVGDTAPVTIRPESTRTPDAPSPTG